MNSTALPSLWMLIAGCLLVDPAHTSAAEPPASQVAWKACLTQKPEWYAGTEAARIADNVLLFQREVGGWPKNLDMAAVLSDRDKARLLTEKGKKQDATIDNGATCTHLMYLARVYEASREERFKAAFLKGLDFLLASQYANGGWPQFPHRTGYYQHITFNDNAMIAVLRVLREVSRGRPPYSFVDAESRQRTSRAVERGVECILKCQIVVDGRRTAWCAQHDERTLQPAPARAYEKISLSGGESVGIVRFLMEIDRPNPQVVEAIESAVRWFEAAKLTGIRQVEKHDPSLPKGRDKVIVRDPAAGPLWARFHEIGTNRPIFCGRDGVIRYALAEIEHERRIGYGWYVAEPAVLLSRDYPAWRARLAASPSESGL